MFLAPHQFSTACGKLKSLKFSLTLIEFRSKCSNHIVHFSLLMKLSLTPFEPNFSPKWGGFCKKSQTRLQCTLSEINEISLLTVFRDFSSTIVHFWQLFSLAPTHLDSYLQLEKTWSCVSYRVFASRAVSPILIVFLLLGMECLYRIICAFCALKIAMH